MDHLGRKLFYDSYREALRDDCKAVDGTAGWAKNIGKMFFPELDPVEAGRRLADMTNPNREGKDRLSDEQERLIMRMSVEKRGFSAANDYVTDEIGMERGKAKERRDEAMALLSRGESLLAEMRHVTDRFERVVRSPLAAVEKKSA